MKRRIALLAGLLSACLLSGCSFAGLDAQTLMRPPKPTGDRAGIHALLESKAGDRMVLKYPRSGDYRSAIIMKNICGDKNEEAMAIYQKDDETAGTNIMFMRKNGKWEDMGFFSNPASQVDRVCFGDLDGNGSNEVIVGWDGGLNNTGSVGVYYYKNGKMNELKVDQGYTELAVMDFDGDGRDEIFTASVSQGDQPALARLFSVKDATVRSIGSCRLDQGVTRYASAKTGLINETQKGIVLDGIKGADTLVTEVLFWDPAEKNLRSPFYDPQTKSANMTLRHTSVVSKDINGDKIIEVPFVSLLPGHTDEKAEDAASYITMWHRFDTQKNLLVPVMSMVLNYSDGYWFLVPDAWMKRITTQADTATRTITFYEWVKTAKNPAGAAGAALLKLQVFSKTEWASGTGTSGFFQVASSGNLIFAASCPSPDNALSLSAAEVRNGFHLMNAE